MEHVRIDEGVKRGPRKNKTKRAKTTKAEITANTPATRPRDEETKRFLSILPADLDDAEIFRRLAAGERISQIAKEYGVTPEAFYMRYQGNQAYLQARENGTDSRLDKGEDEIDLSTDPFSLTRGRELFNAAFRRAQVEFPHRWGQKQEVTLRVPEVALRFGSRVIHSAAPQLPHCTPEITDAELVPGHQESAQDQ